MESVRAGVGGDSGSGSCSSGSCFGGPAILSEGGYDMFPAFAPRWDVATGEVYGRSPAMDVAADCKMLQA
ncbi:MAG: phage tail protein, partial [Mailhella sp.]|nr:phage tail protein [Mailhella sp.]